MVDTAAGVILASKGDVNVVDATISGGSLRTSSGGVITVSGAGNLIKGAIVAADALVEVASGGALTLSGGTISAGAIVETLSSGTVLVSGTVTNGGTLFASGSGSVVQIESGAVVNGGIVEVGNGIVEVAGSGSESVHFLATGSGGGLKIADMAGDTTEYSGKISGFGGSGHTDMTQYIDLADVTSGGSISLHYASGSTSGTLTVSSGATLVATIDLIGTYSSGNFHITSGAGGTVEITDPTAVVNGDTVSNLALFTNYIAAGFVTASAGYGGVFSEAAQDKEQSHLAHPHHS